MTGEAILFKTESVLIFCGAFLLCAAVGFFVCFAIGSALRKRGKIRTETLVGASLLAGFATPFAVFALFIYSLSSVSVTDHFSKPLTVSEARQIISQIPVPDSAQNIQFAEAGEFKGYEYLIRFEAPVEDCRKEFRALVGNASQPLTTRPTPEGRNFGNSMLSSAGWFDVQNIVHGETASDGPDTWWIDEDRGIFYYKRLK